MRMNSKFVLGVVAFASLMLTSCGSSHYQLNSIKVSRTSMNDRFEAVKDPEAVALIEPFKTQLEGTMNSVIGQAAISMDRNRPEDLLGNLVADVLRQAATRVLPQPAEVGLMNMGGIRNVLSEGDITVGNVFEILPFENALCVVKIKGAQLKRLFEQVAGRGGEAISGARIEISKGELLKAEVGGQPIDDERVYTLATIDYLAEGNDGMTALREAVSKEFPENSVLRDVFMDYVKQCTAKGEKLTSKVEGRVTVK